MSKCGEISTKCGENAPKFTLPIIQFGKVCKSKNEQAKQKWLIEFEFNGKRKRVSNYLNKIKTYPEKLKAFMELRDEIERVLIDGTYSNETITDIVNEHIDVYAKSPENTIDNIIAEYMTICVDRGLRAQTVSNYAYVLKYLSNEYGNVLIKDIKYIEMLNLLNKGVNLKKWGSRTYNTNKTIYNSFFNYAIDCEYITDNPLKRIKSKYKEKSENNKAFSKEDFDLILQEAQSNKALLMFMKSIYYTCIRPKELMSLQMKHFDLERRTIFVPAHISKNKQDGYIYIDEAYYNELIKHYKDAPKEAYLFCNRKQLWGLKPYRKNTPYNQLVKILLKLGLNNKGYTLYSTKHYSNIQRFLGGWKIAEIMKANRHASIQQTENYLRHLLDYVDVTKKEIPTL